MQITIDDYNINYQVTGAGEKTAVILQGWGTKMAVYDSVAAAISDRYRVIQLDLPGFGKSTEPREPWSVSDFSAFFVKFLEALGVKSCVLIGHSYGGRMIIKLAGKAVDCPVKIEKIVLIDSAGVLPKKTFAKRFKVARYKLLKNLLNLKISKLLYGDLIEEWKKMQGSEDYRNASPVMKQCLVKAVNEDLTDIMPNITVPTLLVWGDKDTATPLSDGEKMEKLIKGAGLTVLKGTGHYSFLEQPITFKKVIGEFL